VSRQKGAEMRELLIREIPIGPRDGHGGGLLAAALLDELVDGRIHAGWQVAIPGEVFL
jgi:hypothetical protein